MDYPEDGKRQPLPTMLSWARGHGLGPGCFLGTVQGLAVKEAGVVDDCSSHQLERADCTHEHICRLVRSHTVSPAAFLNVSGPSGNFRKLPAMAP